METTEPAGAELAGSAVDAPRAAAPAGPAVRSRIVGFYVVEGISSHSVSLMLASIYFYTTQRYGWGSARNYLLASTLGVIYVVGALSAHAVSVRLGRRATLVAVYLLMSAVAWAAAASHPSPTVLVPLLLAYSGLSAISWPALESLVSSGAAAHELSRRLGIYNCVWSGAGTVTVALAGTLLKYWPTGTFVIPGFWHAVMALWLLTRLARQQEADSAALPADTPAHAPQPEPELLRVRTLALWMSRLALPATFVVISSLLAAMPTLPLIQRLDPTARTVVGSAWMAARWVAFLLLGATAWGDTRARALLT